MNRPDCNNCDAKCDGAKHMRIMNICRKFFAPRAGWKLIELALAYPKGLNEALSALPFKVQIKDYIKC